MRLAAGAAALALLLLVGATPENFDLVGAAT
jgi:hypothetical protein